MNKGVDTSPRESRQHLFAVAAVRWHESALPTDSGPKVAAAQLLRLAGVTIIASARDNLGHKSNRKLSKSP
jgi:hypothetical protein